MGAGSHQKCSALRLCRYRQFLVLEAPEHCSRDVARARAQMFLHLLGTGTQICILVLRESQCLETCLSEVGPPENEHGSRALHSHRRDDLHPHGDLHVPQRRAPQCPETAPPRVLAERKRADG